MTSQVWNWRQTLGLWNCFDLRFVWLRNWPFRHGQRSLLVFRDWSVTALSFLLLFWDSAAVLFTVSWPLGHVSMLSPPLPQVSAPKPRHSGSQRSWFARRLSRTRGTSPLQRLLRVGLLNFFLTCQVKCFIASPVPSQSNLSFLKLCYHLWGVGHQNQPRLPFFLVPASFTSSSSIAQAPPYLQANSSND